MTDVAATVRVETVPQSGLRTGEVVARPPAQRPTHATVESIAEWLIGPALQFATGAQAVDEFAWRMLAAGFPLARVSLHSGTLHPQFLGTTIVWWRDVGQTVQTFIMHEVGDVIPYQKNVALRVIRGGETLRRRIGAGDSELEDRKSVV
jgi:hypothetical protein